jgi:hypothetical protein
MNPAQICEEHRKQIAVLAEQFRVMNNYANPCKDDAVDAIRNSASMIRIYRYYWMDWKKS